MVGSCGQCGLAPTVTFSAMPAYGPTSVLNSEANRPTIEYGWTVLDHSSAYSMTSALRSTTVSLSFTWLRLTVAPLRRARSTVRRFANEYVRGHALTVFGMMSPAGGAAVETSGPVSVAGLIVIPYPSRLDYPFVQQR
ncbi:hypothetical protein Psuf_086730 [Phytohabitans suffuscus]|uniref:Uncharacterized protein n=1 Tax=Phytohabitans suffuscus TaxID=624315 RepID=A0A6F8YYV1_9ACTN|nr:hypothetical protein Psuf_086730 [Phytohabitans suffuscus]